MRAVRPGFGFFSAVTILALTFALILHAPLPPRPAFAAAAGGVAPAMGEQGRSPDAGGADSGGAKGGALYAALEGGFFGALFFGAPYREPGILDLAALALLGFAVVWRLTPAARKTRGREDGDRDARASGLPDRRSPRPDGAQGAFPDTPPERAPGKGRDGLQGARASRSGPWGDAGRDSPWRREDEGSGEAYGPGARSPSASGEFEEGEFLEGARMLYIRVSEARTARDAESLVPFMAPDMMRLMRERAASLGRSGRRILLLKAELLELKQEENRDQARVEFCALMGAEGAAPADCREIWSFARERNQDGLWRLVAWQDREAGQ
jgi:predicted lipid-binding transport protein (Tim44 family)